jgi:hypothetical protein
MVVIDEAAEKAATNVDIGDTVLNLDVVGVEDRLAAVEGTEDG